MHPFHTMGPKMMCGYLLEHLEKLRHVKRCKTCVSGMNAIFWCTEIAEMVSQQMHLFYSIGPRMMFGCLLEHLEILRHVKRCKTCNSGMKAISWCTGVAKMVTHQMHPFYSIGPNIMFGCLLEQLENFRYVKRCKTCVSIMNTIFLCTEVAELVSQEMHLFYFIGRRMMFGCLLEHLENLRHVKRCKTCNSGTKAISWCTGVAEIVSKQMHPFYSIGLKVMFGCLLEQLENLRYVKMQNLCFGPQCTILVYRCCENGFAPNASILHHGTENDVWLSFGAFRKT
jgi:hypothetical protein